MLVSVLVCVCVMYPCMASKRNIPLLGSESVWVKKSKENTKTALRFDFAPCDPDKPGIHPRHSVKVGDDSKALPT